MLIGGVGNGLCTGGGAEGVVTAECGVGVHVEGASPENPMNPTNLGEVPMKARSREHGTDAKLNQMRTLESRPASHRPNGKGHAEGGSVATDKNYAESRLRQFCLR